LVFFHKLERADNAPSVVALRGWKLGAAGLFVDVFEELAYVEGIGDESGEEMDEPVDQRGKRRDVQIRELRVEGCGDMTAVSIRRMCDFVRLKKRFINFTKEPM
jgi:hypothetical protein